MPLPAFNLDHEAVLAFDDDGNALLAGLGDQEGGVVLSRRGQLLLLDALCSAYGFDSPVADVVRKQAVYDGPEAEE